MKKMLLCLMLLMPNLYAMDVEKGGAAQETVSSGFLQRWKKKIGLALCALLVSAGGFAAVSQRENLTGEALEMPTVSSTYAPTLAPTTVPTPAPPNLDDYYIVMNATLIPWTAFATGGCIENSVDVQDPRYLNCPSILSSKTLQVSFDYPDSLEVRAHREKRCHTIQSRWKRDFDVPCEQLPSQEELEQLPPLSPPCNFDAFGIKHVSGRPEECEFAASCSLEPKWCKYNKTDDEGSE